MIAGLRNRAQAAGIQLSYEGMDGRPVEISDETAVLLLAALQGDETSDFVTGEDAGDVPPDRPARVCHLPEWLQQSRAWGLASQLYELRSARDWGIGDFADLAELSRIAGLAGADFIGVNPLHALFLADPDRCSPFSPSNRRFLNPLYIAVDRVEGFDPSMMPEEKLASLRAAELVDYRAVATAKLDALSAIWKRRQAVERPGLASFSDQEGVALDQHATFEALSLRLNAEGYGAGWHGWPSSYRAADGSAVADFAEANADDIAFQKWLQWVARRQLSQAAAAARKSGMRIGLYLDLAVGDAPDGSATWSDPGIAVRNVHIGAPPDIFSANGQDWGLSPLSPRRLSETAFAPYEALMDATMSSAGAVRIDHAMSLRQLFWIPANQTPADGGFVTYPMADLLDVLAEASHRSQTLIIGEDLGHVPEGFRERMEAAGIFSYRIFYFEREAGRFLDADAWPRLALACLSTHDLPTLGGWWAGDDIALRLGFGLIDAESARLQAHEREMERKDLLRLVAHHVHPERREDAASDHPALTDAIVCGIHRFLASTPSLLASARLADLAGERNPTNLPGVANGYPNWRRRLPQSLEDLCDAPLFRAVTQALAEERPR